MLKMFSRVNRNRKSEHYGKVTLEALSVEPPNLGISHLVSDARCIHPVYIDGVKGVCGNLTSGNFVDGRASHGWLCPAHHLRSMVGEFTSRIQALENLDRDNIAFIIAQDRLNLHKGWVFEGHHVCGADCGVRLAPFRGWYPYLPKATGGVHDHTETFSEDEDDRG